MDQQPSPQAPIPPQAPTGMPPQAPTPYSQPPKKNTNLIIGIVIGVVVLLAVVGTILALTLSSKDNGDSDKKDEKTTSKTDSSKKEDTEADDAKKRAANATTATSLTSFNVVCETGSISNAASFEKPYKVVAFSSYDRGGDRQSWSQVYLKYGASYEVKYDSFAEANVVVCLKEDTSKRVKSQSCDFTSSGEKVSVDYYATQFEAVAYEAKTGKKIKSLGTVNAPAAKCPTFATYVKSDPKIIASPDKDALDVLVAAFAA